MASLLAPGTRTSRTSRSSSFHNRDGGGGSGGEVERDGELYGFGFRTWSLCWLDLSSLHGGSLTGSGQDVQDFKILCVLDNDNPHNDILNL